jgi:hypothetical protein
VALCFHIYMAILTSRLLCSLSHCRLALTVVTFSRSSRIDRPACGRALRSATSHRTAPCHMDFDSNRSLIAAALGRPASGQHCKRCIVCLGEALWLLPTYLGRARRGGGRAAGPRARPRQTSRAAIEYFRAQLVLSQGEMHPRCTP